LKLNLKLNFENYQLCKFTVRIFATGANAAGKIFRKHVTILRDEFRLNLQNDYMRFFSKALRKILPDLSKVRSSWHDTLKEMASSPVFPK